MNAPKRIWADVSENTICGSYDIEAFEDATGFVRADLHDATKAQLAKAVEALRFYREQFCEGFCGDCPSTFTSPEMDCSGCKARAVLAEIEKGGV